MVDGNNVVWNKVKFGEITNNHDRVRVPLKSEDRSKMQGEYPYYGAQGIIDYINDFIFDGEYLLIAEDGENVKSQKNDIALIANGQFWVNNHAHVVNCTDNCSITYLLYAINATNIRPYVTGSAQPKLNQDELNKIKLNLPPLPEQKKIADILSTVDEAIQNTKAQIEKTKELKRGMMQKLFSEGIGHTEFKDGKLGRIPKEWEVVKYDKVVKKLFVGIATSTTEYYDNEDTGTLLIRNTNIKNGYLDLSSVEHITKAFDDDNTKKRLRTGDVLSVRTGYPGISAVVPVELDGSQSFTTLVSRFDQSIVNPYFVCYQLNSELGRSQIKNLQFGGQQQNLNVGSLRLLDLIVPPKEEQDRIVEILKVVDNKKDNLDQELKLQIDKKKGLMQKLLTGEVRVKI
jgi:type I restriction enzyme S subunit